MYESLLAFFSHSRSIGLLFVPASSDHAVDPSVLSYFLCASLWRSNLSYLDKAIKLVAFTDLRRPSVRINDRLHDLRQDLNTLRDEVRMAKKWISPEVDEQFYDCVQVVPLESPEDTFSDILSESGILESFLIDTFQLLVSTISVLDSQANILDARRGARLTQLATIYVPLSFVTGIFGMNIKEINGSSLPAWTAVVALVVVAILTAALLWLMTSLPDPTASVTDKRKVQPEHLIDGGKTWHWRRHSISAAPIKAEA